ncbi:MarR family transcriptional regulator [Hoyosella sp. G463]|uniref:MarR family transcriptional regulator n=1 Tax=Lolliginicoccus lacisalsi TaxID=2742202 RepID=A0A927PKS8_9ACTN|nr:MarR family transcriptional regulator [Lolliginicoccus lacisalsi]MBD8505099.1 MarR family transcriptional regulator [Lolliginicoccus lacisalsi]
MTAHHRVAEARELGFKLLDVTKRMSEDFDAIAVSLGLTPLQARTVLEMDAPSPMRALAESMGCDASNVTGLADRLERLGIVERVPGADRRVKLLALTDRGAELREELARMVAEGSTVMARLDRSERAALEQLLDKLLG